MGSEPNTLNIYRSFDDRHIIYFAKNLKYDGVIGWLADQSVPEVVEMSMEYVDLIFSKENPKNVLVLFSDF